MTALAKNTVRQQKAHQREINVAPVNAGSVVYVGAYLCREAATGVVIPGADTAGLIPLGVVVENMFPDDAQGVSLSAALDNTSGADGTITVSNGLDTMERVVRYDQAGEYAFAVASGTPKVGGLAYLVDDNTTQPGITTNGVIAGWYTRPSPNGGWFVDIGKRGISAQGAGALASVTPGSKVAFGEAALDASNPTPIATGLATVVAFSATLKGSAAPGDNTSVLTALIAGAAGNVDVYAWKNTGGTDPTLVASTGTESFYWVAVGT